MIYIGKIGIIIGFILLFISINNGYYTGFEIHRGKVVDIKKDGFFYQYRIIEKNEVVCMGLKTDIRENQTITYETTPGKCFIWDYR